MSQERFPTPKPDGLPDDESNVESQERFDWGKLRRAAIEKTRKASESRGDVVSEDDVIRDAHNWNNINQWFDSEEEDPSFRDRFAKRMMKRHRTFGDMWENSSTSSWKGYGDPNEPAHFIERNSALKGSKSPSEFYKDVDMALAQAGFSPDEIKKASDIVQKEIQAGKSEDRLERIPYLSDDKFAADTSVSVKVAKATFLLYDQGYSSPDIVG